MARERIIKESYLLFVRYGVKTTMDDISKHMGISKRTIYENFKDKSELLSACIEHMAEQAHYRAVEIFENSDNVLEAVLQMLYHQYARGPQNFKYMMELGKYYPDVYKNHLIKSQEKKLQGMEELIRRGIAEGVFRDDVNPMLASFMFSEQANLIFSEQFQKFNEARDSSFDGFSEVSIFQNMVVTYMRGVSTAKGLEILEQ